MGVGRGEEADGGAPYVRWGDPAEDSDHRGGKESGICGKRDFGFALVQ